MYGQCKNCSKLFSCRKPRKWGCGFCETDFEPMGKPQTKTVVSADQTPHMKWVQTTSTNWEAVGKDGAFYIERSRGLFWGRYASKDKAFKNKPKKTLKEAKTFCEDNYYWE